MVGRELLKSLYMQLMVFLIFAHLFSVRTDSKCASIPLRIIRYS